MLIPSVRQRRMRARVSRVSLYIPVVPEAASILQYLTAPVLRCKSISPSFDNPHPVMTAELPERNLTECRSRAPSPAENKGRCMKRPYLAVLASCLVTTQAVAQEHYTEGPVWECSSYRTKQGHFDDYLEYLRQNFVPQSQQAKKAGLVLDQKTYLHVPANPTEPDVLLCTQHSNFAKALDYDATVDAKGKEIAAKHYKTADEKRQREMAENRLAFRDFLGTSYWREVNLRPMAGTPPTR